jgi:hypothetical protein
LTRRHQAVSQSSAAESSAHQKPNPQQEQKLVQYIKALAK